MANGPMVSHSYHGRAEDVSRRTLQWSTRWHSPTFPWHLRQLHGAAAEAAADRKTAKYTPLTQSYLFVPIAVETTGAINRVGKEFLSDLGRRITQMTNEQREGAFLFQRLSMVIQRYNAVAIQGTFALTSPEDEL